MPAFHSKSRLPAATATSDRAADPVKHPYYYFSTGDVVIRVQNTLFKLDLSVLHEKSPVLRNIMPPVYAGKTRLRGFDFENPFMLREIAESDFVRLLWVLYPTERQSFQATTVEDWVSILKLATWFEIKSVREKAVACLHALPVDPVRKIAIWDEYHLDPALLVSSYVALCQRAESLTLATLGLRNFTKLAAAHDIYHQRTGFGCCKRQSPTERQAIAEEIIIGIFAPCRPKE